MVLGYKTEKKSDLSAMQIGRVYKQKLIRQTIININIYECIASRISQTSTAILMQ